MHKIFSKYWFIGPLFYVTNIVHHFLSVLVLLMWLTQPVAHWWGGIVMVGDERYLSDSIRILQHSLFFICLLFLQEPNVPNHL